ncbi:Oligoribonuclease, mitochondrial [Rhizoclosmatium sp. JEL0117]|nr:Oligoribonuclease, mitochondrial [Rhizoclosmatium sp. JEL0117]
MATTSQIKKPLVWIDLEMSGLDLKKDRILEIACIITDGDLNVVAESEDLIVRTDKALLDGMDEWCVQHHGQSGLTQSALTSPLSMQQVETQILDFIKLHIPQKNVGVLAGNSVHMDKEFLRKDMPSLLEHLHYRLVDVSTIKELMARWNPRVLAGAPKKKESHRALDDIRESIEELRYYRTAAFKE